MNCREKCRWARVCDLPGTDDEPDLCPRAWKLEDYWHEARDMETAMDEAENRHKYEQGDENNESTV